jgi:hypothetical protein
VLQQANATMDKVAVVLGENSKNKSHNSEADQQAIDSIISDLSDVSERGNDFTALSIATTITTQLANSNELHHVDDAFYSYLDGGGDSKLFNTLIGTMQAADHGKGAEGLKERGGNWIVDGIIDAADSVAGALANVVGGALGVIKDFTVDAATGVVNVVTDVGEFAVDLAKGTIDVVGDAANITKEAVEATVNAAVEAGLALGEKAATWVVGRLNEAIDDAIDENKINDLGAGDSYSIFVDGGGGAALVGSAHAEATVTRNEDGTYTVSAELGGGFGVGIGEFGAAEGTLSGRVEFTYGSAAEATEGTRDILRTAVAGSLAGAALESVAGGLAPTDDDIESLKDHVSAVEVSAGAQASIGVFAGLGVDLGAIDFSTLDGASASVSAETTTRIEFKNGKPVSLVSRQTITLEADAANNPAILLALDRLGVDASGINIDGSISVELESRIPINGLAIDSIGDIVELVRNPDSLKTQLGNVEHTVTVKADATVNDEKVSIEWEITDVDASEIPDAVIGVLTGNFDKIRDAVDVEQTTGFFKIDEMGIDLGFVIGSVEVGSVLEDRDRKRDKTEQVA